MQKETAYPCAACSDPMVFDQRAHTLCCDSCGREYGLNMQPV